MDVTTFYTKINYVEHSTVFTKQKASISIPSLEGALILQENAFQFNEKNIYLETKQNYLGN